VKELEPAAVGVDSVVAVAVVAKTDGKNSHLIVAPAVGSRKRWGFLVPVAGAHLAGKNTTLRTKATTELQWDGVVGEEPILTVLVPVQDEMAEAAEESRTCM